LVETVIAHPELKGLRRFVLVTRDAHGRYELSRAFDQLSIVARAEQGFID